MTANLSAKRCNSLRISGSLHRQIHGYDQGDLADKYNTTVCSARIRRIQPTTYGFRAKFEFVCLHNSFWQIIKIDLLPYLSRFSAINITETRYRRT